MIELVPHKAKNIPKPPARAPYRNPSTRNAPVSRKRLAPQASRIEISFSRENALASCTKAKVEHAIKSSRATAPDRIARAGRAPSVIEGHQKVMRNDKSLSVAGYCS